MANYHAHIKILSRTKRNTVRSIAYRSGTMLTDEQTSEVFDYSRKKVQHVDFLIPDSAPEWAKDLKTLIHSDRRAGVQKLSDMAEIAEKRIDAQVYKDFEFTLPRELTEEQNIALAKEFIHDQFCQRGIAVVANFHFDISRKTGAKNPHCHAVLLTRELTEDGLATSKNREWNNKSLLQNWREQLAAYTNFHLALHGHEARVDHRSYEERGIDIEPQPKYSRGLQESEERTGINPHDPYTPKTSDKAEEFRQVKLRNIYRIMKAPELVFEIATKNQVTFMWGDVQKVLARYIDDAEVFQALETKLQNSKELVTLHEAKDGHIYTTQKLLQKELSLITKAESLSQKTDFSIDQQIIHKHVEKFDQRSKDLGHAGLSPDQRQAIQHMVSAPNLVSVVGYAGTGKTFAVECARDIWQENGYQVIGLAPTGKAADNLAQSAGIKAMTVHKFLRGYEQGRNQFNKNTILVLDEAGIVDLTRFEELLSAVDKLGVKLATLGDGRQLQSVEAGTAFRLISKQASHLETVIRQKIDWMSEATQQFGRGQTETAIQQYQERGHIQIVHEQLPNIDTLINKQDWRGVVEAWQRSIRHQKLSNWTFKSGISLTPEEKVTGQRVLNEWQEIESKAKQAVVDHYQQCQPYFGMDGNARQTTINRLIADWHQDQHIMLAFTNKDVLTINQQARQLLKQDGALDKQEFIHKICRLDENDFGEVTKTHGTRAFAKGDRIQFMKNDNRLGVKNGMLGTVTNVDKQKLAVQLDGDQKTVSFATNLYPYVDHAYAITVNKAQGMTAKKAYVLATNHFTRNLSYVALTRHKEDLKVYYSNAEAWSDSVATKQLAKTGEKLSSLDYLDANQLSILVKQDNKILEQAYQKVCNHLQAAAYIAKRLFGSAPKLLESNIAQPSLTEAERWTKLHEAREQLKQGYQPSDEYQKAMEEFRKSYGVAAPTKRTELAKIPETKQPEPHIKRGLDLTF
jgi:Ti-type conjugative transfer relaxase TraA